MSKSGTMLRKTMCPTIHFMIKATQASAVNHAQDPSNPKKTSEPEDGGGNHQTRKNAAYMSINERG